MMMHKVLQTSEDAIDRQNRMIEYYRLENFRCDMKTLRYDNYLVFLFGVILYMLVL